MKRLKRVFALFLVFVLFLNSSLTGYAADDADASYNAEVSVGDEDLSGQMFEEIFGDGSAYQVLDVAHSEDGSGFDVTYTAAAACILGLIVYDEASSEQTATYSVPVEAGTATIHINVDASSWPAYYWLDAVLTRNEAELSSAYSYCYNTQAYQSFLNESVDDNSYEDQVVLDYGTDDEGNENFAVVNSDVKIIYVDSIDCVDIISGNESASLFSLVENNDDGYIFTDVVNDEVLDDLESGDCALILPMDDLNEARPFVVDTVEETATLMDEDGTAGVEVTTNSEDVEIGDFFDYIRINVTVEADTGDIDTSDCDEDIVFLDEEVVDESAGNDEDMTADLFGSGSKSVEGTATKSLTISKKSGAVTVKDTVSLSATVGLSINYKTTLKIPTKITSITATAKVTAKNVFNITATKGYSVSQSWHIGTIPIGTVAGVSFSIPVDLVFSFSASATLSFTATQTATSSLTIKYSSGSYSYTSSKSASSTKELETEAKATVSLGIKPAVKASFLSIISVSFAGEAGVKAVATLQSINKTKTYQHSGVVCLSVDLYIYLTPSFTLKLASATLASKTWSTIQSKFLSFYAHLGTNGKWSYGTGNCPERKYRVTLTTQSSNGKALNKVKVKEGTAELGETDDSGKLSVWLSMKSHTLKFSRSGYTTGTLVFTVSSAVSKSIKLYKSGANESYYSISDLTAMSEEALSTFMNDADLSNTIFTIESASELAALSEFAASHSTDGLRFVLNGSDGVIDLSGYAWTPIGSEAYPFQGELDGNGFTINGLTVASGASYAGLFGYVSDALIHDITICNASVSGGNYTGALAGYAGPSTAMYDIAVLGGTVSGNDYTGGILGAMVQAELLNSYTTAFVSGGMYVGGITGSFACTDTLGQISNCYSGCTLSGSGMIGGVCGECAAIETAAITSDTDEAEAHTVGILYAYYLNTTAESAVADGSGSAEVITYSVSEEQATGQTGCGMIAEDGSFACAETLVDALNNWYAAYGSSQERDESSEDGVDAMPDASASDYYNRWYADSLDDSGAFSNGGYPVFAQKDTVYALTVHYVFEDGSEAMPTVVLYKTEGQAYDVDSYVIEGYHTYEEEYKGEMPASDLEYRVIYIADDPYDGSVSGLSIENPAESGKTYSVGSANDLIALAEYVAAGGTTAGINFIQTSYIDLSGSAFVGIGSEESPFRGSFDGQYLGIENLSCSLFGYIDGADITSVVIVAAIVGNAGETIGTVSAVSKNSAIRLCTVTAEISGNASLAGGIAGSAADTLINQCAVDGSLYGSLNAGGIAGLSSGGSVINCSSSVDVSGSTCVGGLLGSGKDSAIVANSYTTGDVEGTSNVGGIIGTAVGMTVANVYHTGAVSGANCDALIASASDTAADSLWYLNGSTSVGGSSITNSSDGTAVLLEALNEWVTNEGSTAYLTWSQNMPDDGDGSVLFPVFGMQYTNWLTDYVLSNSTISYTYDPEFYSDGTAYIAMYTAEGQMIAISEIAGSVSGLVVDSDTSYAQAYILAEDYAPLSAVIVIEQ